MKNKLGIIGALVLSLTIAGSAFAANTTPSIKTSNPAAAKTAKTTKVKKHRKHRRHRAAKKVSTMPKTTTNTMTKKSSPK